MRYRPDEAAYALLEGYLHVAFRLLEGLASVQEAELALRDYLPQHRRHQLPAELEQMLCHLLEDKRQRDLAEV